MKITSKIRLENLNLLVKEAGGVTQLAKRAGYKQSNYLYQIINRTPVQNGKAKNIGSNMASKLEEAMNKPKGWMDQEHQKNSKSNSVYLGTLEIWGYSKPSGDIEIEVPFYKEISFSASNDFAEYIKDYNIYKLCFARSILQSTALIQNPLCALQQMAIVCILLFQIAVLSGSIQMIKIFEMAKYMQ